MNIDRFIKHLDSAYSDAEKSIKMISWPKNFPEIHPLSMSSNSNKSSTNVVGPIVGGVGCISLIGGLITDKIGFTVLGSALMIGAFWVKRFQKPLQQVEAKSKMDFQELKHQLDTSIYENVKRASDQWNSAISTIHNSLNQEILSSDISESQKTEMLSASSEEFPLLLSSMEISLQLQSLVSGESISGMKKALEDYRDKSLGELHQAYESQLKVYKGLVD